MKKNIIALAVAALFTTEAFATPNSYYESANIYRDGVTVADRDGWDHRTGTAISSWGKFAENIEEAHADGITGEGVKIAITEPSAAQRRDRAFTIGTGSTAYNGFGSHDDRMARAAGGTWTDANGNKAQGVASGAVVDIVGTIGTERTQTFNADGSFHSETVTQLPANHTLHTYDIASASFSSVGRHIPSIGYEANGDGYDITDVIERSYEFNKGTGNTFLYVTSAGNNPKSWNINDINVTGILNANQDQNLLIVTGLNGGNRAANDQQAARMITAPYVYQGINGTSHATAIVSGHVALVMDKFDTNSVDAANRILETADRKFNGWNLRDHGQGKIDLSRALSPIGDLR